MKKNKTPFALRFIGWLFPKLEKLLPSVAYKWYSTIFFTPVRYKLPPPEVELALSANQYFIDVDDRKIRVYEWGEGPVVLFVHGWMGRATQFRKLIPDYNAAGYKVIAFDAPAHGQSEGKQTNPMEFADVIKELSDRYGGFLMILGHSLGGVSILHAINNGVETEKVVMISSPTIDTEILTEFRARINASEKCDQYLQSYISNKFGRPFKEFTASHVISLISGFELLVVHDEEDPEVSMNNPQAIIDKYSGAKLMTTKGLGHTRILKDKAVVGATLEFLKRHKFAATVV